jgi:ABC-type sugar transport system ATPase subunit
MEIKNKNGNPMLVTKNLEIPCEEERIKQLVIEGKESVIVGIRPENILLNHEIGCVPVKGSVYFTERLGGETIIHVTTDCKRFVVKISGDAVFTENQNINVFLAVKKICLFHPDTEEALG